MFLTVVLTRRNQSFPNLTFPDVRITAVSCDEEGEHQTLRFLAAVLICRIRKPLVDLPPG
jgi:hypothetical protein